VGGGRSTKLLWFCRLVSQQRWKPLVSSFTNLLLLRRESCYRHRREADTSPLFATLIIPRSMQSYTCVAVLRKKLSSVLPPDSTMGHVFVSFCCCATKNDLLFAVQTIYWTMQLFPCVGEYQANGLRFAGPQIPMNQ